MNENLKDARGYYEDALSELDVLVEMFSGTEEALEAIVLYWKCSQPDREIMLTSY